LGGSEKRENGRKQKGKKPVDFHINSLQEGIECPEQARV